MVGKKAGGFETEIDGVKYVSIGVVAERLGKTVQTIRLWSKWSDEQEAQGLERYIPNEIRVGNRHIRCFKESDMPKIEEFSKAIKYGSLSKYNRSRWGARGNIKIDKSLSN